MQVIREISRGGFGVVEEVEDWTGERFARKTFNPGPAIRHDAELLNKARRRFIREVGIQARLDHPHIVPIVDHDLEADPPWFTMPLAEETYVRQIQRDAGNGALDLDAMLQVLAGLEELHRLGYVHRDLKPQNILKIDGRWAISDFGLVLPSSREVESLTSTSSAWGTQGYMAPEVLTNFRAAPPQADIFAIGCILHDAFGGTPRVPYARATTRGPLGHIIERCTERDAEDRFPCIAALRSALVTTLATPVRTSVPQINSWAAQLADDPGRISRDAWANIIRYIEHAYGTNEAELLLRTIDLPQIEAAHAASRTVFARLVAMITGWVRDGAFAFEYCDVLGARLLRIYELGEINEKAQAAVAALSLACSHNRWFVMRIFMRMAGPSIDSDLADRLAVEMCTLDADAAANVRQIEDAINTSRDSLHSKVREAVNEIDARTGRREAPSGESQALD